MNRLRVVFGFVIALLTLPSLATTWTESKVEDPFLPGKVCSVHEPMSYGGYIYRWPSKYDFVFWPLTDVHGIWHCEHSGFTSFIGDFEGLSDKERADIAVYLAANYEGKDDVESRLKLLEDTYSLRTTDSQFENKLLRVLARWYQDNGQVDKANGYRRKAFEELKGFLKVELMEERRLEYLYLAANYSRQLGEVAASDRYLVELEKAIENITNPELSGLGEYLSELAKETKLIQPGGQLDPVLE